VPAGTQVPAGFLGGEAEAITERSAQTWFKVYLLSIRQHQKRPEPPWLNSVIPLAP
jgi:hypothetical protein